MSRITEVVKQLLIINVLMFLGTQFMGEPSEFWGLIKEENTGIGNWGRYQLAMFFPTSTYFRPWQIVSHMFMHADLTHLFFNMFAIFIFGPLLEVRWGEKKFLFYYLFTGFGAMLLYLLVKMFELQALEPGTEAYQVIENVPMLGASGAVFGVLLGFGMKFPDMQLQLIFPPIRAKAKYMVGFYIIMELFLGLGPFTTGVAHWAHLGGALFGFLLIKYWQVTGTEGMGR